MECECNDWNELYEFVSRRLNDTREVSRLLIVKRTVKITRSVAGVVMMMMMMMIICRGGKHNGTWKCK
jgi:hypothetical protein